MTFGRSEADFWRMTPAKLHALSDTHIEAHSDSTKPSSTSKPSSNPRSDLAALGADL